MMELIREALARSQESTLAFDAGGNPRPPWKEFPEYERYSLGWRMGGGEDYWLKFHDWLRDVEPEKRERYRELYPEPEAWSGFYEQAEIDIAARK